MDELSSVGLVTEARSRAGLESAAADVDLLAMNLAVEVCDNAVAESAARGAELQGMLNKEVATAWTATWGRRNARIAARERAQAKAQEYRRTAAGAAARAASTAAAEKV